MTKSFKRGRVKPGGTRGSSSWIFRSGKGSVPSWRNRGTGKIVRAPNTASEKRLDILGKRSKTREVTSKHNYGFDKLIGRKKKGIKGLKGF